MNLLTLLRTGITKTGTFLELARWHSAAGAGLAVWVGGHLAGASWQIQWLHPMAIAILLSAAGNAYNDANDVALDRINRPQRPIPRRAITPQQANLFAFLCGVTAFLLAIPLGLPTILGTGLALLLLYSYSPYLKTIPLFGNGIVGLLVGMCIGFGGLIAGNIPVVVLPAIAVGLLFGGREVLKTLHDVAGDQSHHIRTLATLWGPRLALLVASLTFGIALMVLGVWAGTYERRWIVTVATLLLVATTMIPLWRSPDAPRVIAWALGWSKALGLALLLLLALV